VPNDYEYRDAIVSTECLYEHRSDPELRVFECTTYLDYLPEGQDVPYRVVRAWPVSCRERP